MYHPEILHRIARERQETFIHEARMDRLVRELSAAEHHEPRERFSVRHLRWILFRPLGA